MPRAAIYEARDLLATARPNIEELRDESTAGAFAVASATYAVAFLLEAIHDELRELNGAVTRLDRTERL